MVRFPPQGVRVPILAEHTDSESTFKGSTAQYTRTYLYSNNVASGETILSASITLTKRCMVVVVTFACVYAYAAKFSDIKRGEATVTKETIIISAPFIYTNGLGHLQYATEVLDPGTYTYSLVNTSGSTITVHGAVMKIVAVEA
jgi:hypothetical protein